MFEHANYVRFQSPRPDSGGRFVGVFGLVNMLAKRGRLTTEQERFRRVNNDWYDTAYPNPTTVDPTVYDPAINPGAVAWFRSSATGLISRVAGYLDILDAHGVGWVRLESIGLPGRLIYQDQFQVVVADRRPGGQLSETGRLV